jgi:hypothetical protein
MPVKSASDGNNPDSPREELLLGGVATAGHQGVALVAGALRRSDRFSEIFDAVSLTSGIVMSRVRNIVSGLMVVAAVVAAAVSAHAQSTINTGQPATAANLNSLVVRQLALAAASDINGILGGHSTTTLAGCPASPTQFADCLVLGPPVNWYKYYSSGWQIIGTFSPTFSPYVGGVALPFVIPVGTPTLYVSPTGNDTGNNCTNSGTPCTLHGACAAATQFASFRHPGAVAISPTHGFYSAVDSNNDMCDVEGNAGGNAQQLVVIQGDCGSPTAVEFDVPAGDKGIVAQDGGQVITSCVKITGGNGSTGIYGRQLAIADYDTVTWGAWGTSGAHVSGTGYASVNMTSGGETLTAGFPGVIHWNFSDGAHLSAGGPTVIPTAIDYTGGNFLGAANSLIDLTGWSTSGAGVAGTTGNRANLSGHTYLATNGTSINATFPGNQSSVMTQGAQDSNGDNQTSPMPVGGVACSGSPTSSFAATNGVVTHC